KQALLSGSKPLTAIKRQSLPLNRRLETKRSLRSKDERTSKSAVVRSRSVPYRT
ncbi:hypothetical protein GCK32_019341, partial [Trichostrongylus colubriformis]